MRINLILIVVMGFRMLICKSALSQVDIAGVDIILHFPSSFFNKDKQKTAKSETQFSKQNERFQQFTNKIKSNTGKRNGALRGEFLPGTYPLGSRLLVNAKQVQKKERGSLAGENQIDLINIKTSEYVVYQNNRSGSRYAFNRAFSECAMAIQRH